MRNDPDYAALLSSWVLSLRAERKSSQTVASYRDGVSQYLDWCATTDTQADLSRASVAGFVTHLLDTGKAGATARARQLAIRRFSAWLLAEGEIAHDPLAGMKPPKLDTTVVQPLSDDQLRALLRACAGTTLRDRRDEAVVRLMFECGLRRGEVVNLEMADVDLLAGTAVVRRGKGGSGRVVPFGPQTARAIDRYLRLRRNHRLAGSPALWLGERGHAFTEAALYATLRRRAKRAGIDGFHPHLLRHTAAHRWLAAGGSESGLLAVAGWTRPDMLMRYTKAQAASRAAEEARSLNLGDL